MFPNMDSRRGRMILALAAVAACGGFACGAPTKGDSISQGELQCKPPQLSAPKTPMPEFLWNLPALKNAPRDLAVPCYPYFSHAAPSKIVPPPDPVIPLQTMAIVLASIMLGVLVLIVARFGNSTYPLTSPKLNNSEVQEIEMDSMSEKDEVEGRGDIAGPSESSEGENRVMNDKPPRLAHWDSVLEAEVVRLGAGSTISWDENSISDGEHEVQIEIMTTARSFTSDLERK